MINGTVEQWLFAFSQTEKFLCITNYIKKKYNLDSDLLPVWDYEVYIRNIIGFKISLNVDATVNSVIAPAAGRYQAILSTERIPTKTFYYIEYILQHTEEKYILDVGCGQNFFATFYDEIQGMEPNQVDKDLNIINETWNDEFIQKNIEKIPNIIAITSLHHVYGLFEIPKLLEDLVKVLKSGGYCYISFSLRRLLMRTTVDEMKYNKIFTYDDINKYFKRELQKQLNIELIEFSNDMDHGLPSVIISPSKIPHEVHIIKVFDSPFSSWSAWPNTSENVNAIAKANTLHKGLNPLANPCIGGSTEGSISIIFNKK